MLVVADIEANSLTPDRLWVIVTKEVESGNVRVFREPDKHPEEFREYASTVTGWIGHNFLSFDGPVINRLVPEVFIDPKTIIDTLVVSRVVDFKRPGGHGIGAWGDHFRFPKGDFPAEWFATFLDHWEDGLKYCKQDVEINFKVFEALRPFIFSPKWREALRLEHDTEMMCAELHTNGFAYDIDRSRDLLGRLDAEIKGLEDEFQVLFPPRYKLVREITPTLTKTGRLHSKDFRWLQSPEDISHFEAGVPFSLVERFEFDPASPMQRIDRLWEAGWKPVVKTKGHKDFLKVQRRNRRKLSPEEREEIAKKKERYDRYGWTLDDTNLATLPDTAPEGAKKLARWLHLNGRANMLRGWEGEFNPESGRIHGKFWHIGAWSGRMSHSNPNMANAPADAAYRSLWLADPGKVLIGCDAEGIQLRILAHYINDPVFTEALVSGDKKIGTDAHSLNAKALGEVCLKHGAAARDRAKTFIYAFVLGARPPKIAEIFECHPILAEEAVERFVAAYPGLAKLKAEIIPADARRGYFQGFDGRFVKQDSEHLMLAGYLQGGEQTIMKYARRLWSQELKAKGIWHKQVNLVHDEFQTNGNASKERMEFLKIPYAERKLIKAPVFEDEAQEIGRTQAWAITQAGIDLNVRAPQAGEFRVGLNWSETH